MMKKPGRTGQRKLLKATLPTVLGKPLPPFARLRGASLFAAALEHATKEQVAKAQHLVGNLDPARMVEIYKKTGNPAWLWMALGASPPGGVPTEVMTYLRTCARQVFDEVVGQVTEMERVRIEEGKPPEEGIIRQPQRHREVTGVGHLFQLSHTGRNPLREAAKDLRSLSMAVAAEDLTQNKGKTLNEACAFLAIMNGRSSVTTGPAVTAMRTIINRGRRLLDLVNRTKR